MDHTGSAVSHNGGIVDEGPMAVQVNELVFAYGEDGFAEEGGKGGHWWATYLRRMHRGGTLGAKRRWTPRWDILCGDANKERRAMPPSFILYDGIPLPRTARVTRMGRKTILTSITD